MLGMTSLQTMGPQAVGILGGMGPAAGAAFAERFVQACANWLRGHGLPVNDQAFPEHWLVQASVPDRTAWLVHQPDAASPLGAMQHALHRLASVGVKAGRLEEAQGHFADMAQALVRRHGCQAVVMGCTEIPLALPPAAVQAPLIDPADVLAAALAERAYGPAC